MRRFRPRAKAVFIEDKVFYWLKHDTRQGIYCFWLGTYWKYLQSLWGYAEADGKGTFTAYVTRDTTSNLNKADLDPFRYGPACSDIKHNMTLPEAMETIENRIDAYLKRVELFKEENEKRDYEFEQQLLKGRSNAERSNERGS